jgi:hypothetical protein
LIQFLDISNHREFNKMVKDLPDIGGAVFGVLCLAGWYLAQPEHEPRAMLWIGISSLVVVAIHKAYDFGHGAMSEQERTDLYQKRKAALEQANRQIRNERHHLEKLSRDPSLAPGKMHSETAPFIHISSSVQPLLVYPGYKKVAEQIITECKNVLTLPSGKRDASRLMAPLRKLYGKIAAGLREPDDWEEIVDTEKVETILGLMGWTEQLAGHCAKHDKYAGEDTLRIWGHPTRGSRPVAIISGKKGTENHRVLMSDGRDDLADANQLELFSDQHLVQVFREAFARASE